MCIVKKMLILHLLFGNNFISSRYSYEILLYTTVNELSCNYKKLHKRYWPHRAAAYVWKVMQK